MCVCTRTTLQPAAFTISLHLSAYSCQMPKEEEGPPTLVLLVPPEPTPGLNRSPSSFPALAFSSNASSSCSSLLTWALGTELLELEERAAVDLDALLHELLEALPEFLPAVRAGGGRMDVLGRRGSSDPEALPRPWRAAPRRWRSNRTADPETSPSSRSAQSARRHSETPALPPPARVVRAAAVARWSNLLPESRQVVGIAGGADGVGDLKGHLGGR
eukprot:284988-Hanusia_phi.AAC.2